MTNEEAKEYFLQHECVDDKQQSEAVWCAINSLGKQIPKKLAILPEPYINAKKYGCCPTCQWTEIDYRWGMREGTTITYCPRCGQSLSWEVEND